MHISESELSKPLDVVSFLGFSSFSGDFFTSRKPARFNTAGEENPASLDKLESKEASSI